MDESPSLASNVRKESVATLPLSQLSRRKPPFAEPAKNRKNANVRKVSGPTRLAPYAQPDDEPVLVEDGTPASVATVVSSAQPPGFLR